MLQPYSIENGSILDISGDYLPTCKAYDVAWLAPPYGGIFFYDIENECRLSYVNFDGTVEFQDERDGTPVYAPVTTN